jgi:hypothetical protein
LELDQSSKEACQKLVVGNALVVLECEKLYADGHCQKENCTVCQHSTSFVLNDCTQFSSVSEYTSVITVIFFFPDEFHHKYPSPVPENS